MYESRNQGSRVRLRMGWWGPVVVAAAAATSSQACAPGPTSGGEISETQLDLSIDSAGWYQLVNGASQLCLDNQNGSLTSGSPIDQASCAGLSPDTQWQLKLVSGTTYMLTNRTSGDCLSNGNHSSSGQPVSQASGCSPSTNYETWAATDLGNGFVTLQVTKTGMCLTNPGGSATAGTVQQEQTCVTGNTSMMWKLVKADASPPPPAPTIDPTAWYQLVNHASQLCLDDQNGSTTSGSPVDQAACGPGSDTQWRFSLVSGSTYMLFNRTSSDCLSNGNHSSSGQPVSQASGCSASTSYETWALTDLGTGYVTLKVTKTGMCLADPAGSTTAGTVQQEQTCVAGNATMEWRLVKVDADAEPPPATAPVYSDPTLVRVPSFPSKTCPVAPGGSINAAIAACNAAGGGTVTLSAGTYATGSIHVMSNVRVSLGGATITTGGTIDSAESDSQIATQYPSCQDDGHEHWHNALIWGENVSNVAFIGPGKIDGAGLDTNAQKLVAFKNSKVVLFDNLSMKNTGHFGFLMTNVQDLTLSNLTMTPTRDGVDLMECSNVYAHHLSITGGSDDAFALKSDCTVGTPVVTNNITVTNSTFGSGCNAMQIGSETWGDFQNITWSNNRIISGAKSGIGLQMNDGGNIKNVVYDGITISGTAFPIFMSTTSLLRASKTTPGHAENIRFSNITATNITGSSQTSGANSVIVISGEPGVRHSGIVLDHLNMTFHGGGSGTSEPPEGSTFTNPSSVNYNPRFISPLPAYGAYIRHATGVELRNVTFTVGSDARPALVARDVAGLQFETFSGRKAGASTLQLYGITNLGIISSPPLPDTSVASITSATY
jgi:hypothetical protein